MGYSRGGFGTKIHLISDSTGTYTNAIISAGQEHETQRFDESLESVRVSSSHGPAKRRPNHICGDKGYACKVIRDKARKSNVTPIIPYKSNEKIQREIDHDAYKKRNMIERIFGRLKEFRRIATRYEKLAIRYLAMLKIAAICIWLKKQLFKAHCLVVLLKRIL